MVLNSFMAEFHLETCILSPLLYSPDSLEFNIIWVLGGLSEIPLCFVLWPIDVTNKAY